MNKQPILSYISLVIFIACLLSLSQAIPLTDVSSTSVIKMKDTAGRLVVSVKRVDDLLDDNGTLLAERISAIIMNFELMDDHLLLDSMPVRLGIKDIQIIKAKIVPLDIKEEDIYKYDENFDIGLVKVEVSADVVQTDSLPKIFISIKVIEVDGVQISSTNVIENTWEFELSKNADDDQNQPLDGDRLSHQPCSSLKQAPGRLNRWWQCSSKYTRIFVASLFITAIFAIFHFLVSVTINALMSFMSSSNNFEKYQKVLQYESEKYESMHGEVEQVIFVADEYNKLES